MSAKLFSLLILTPDKTVFNSKVSSLIVPSELGYMGVLADHAPLIANITKGRITFSKETGEITELNSGGEGFLEILKNKVTLLLSGVS